MRCEEIHPSGERCGLEAGHEGNHRLEAAHRCHAVACMTRVPPRMLMCKKHWAMVPRLVQTMVWSTYREGQCDDKNPSSAWHYAADHAIVHVAIHEGHTLTGRLGEIARQLIERSKLPEDLKL